MKIYKVIQIHFFMTSLILACGIFLSAQSAQAEEMPLIPTQGDGSNEGFFPYRMAEDSQQNAQKFIDMKTEYEENRGIVEPGIYRDENGRIYEVVESDGKVINYTYETDKEDNIDRIILYDGNREVAFTESYMSREKINKDEAVVLSEGGTETPEFSDGIQKSQEPVIIPQSDKDDKIIKKIPIQNIDLNIIAKERVDFEAINKAFDDLDKREQEARKRFYDRLEEELRKVSSLQSDLGVDLSNYTIKDKELTNGEEREATIEEIAEYIYSIVLEDNAAKEDKSEDTYLEKILREILLSNIEIYEMEIKEAEDVFRQEIKSLLPKSPYASFSINYEKKINAIINLSPAEDKEDTSKEE